MKTINKFYYSVLVLVMTLMVFVSCETEDVTIEETNQELLDEKSSENLKSTIDQEIDFVTKTSRSCPDDLTNDGCNFLSGSGRDFPNQHLMVDMLNNCRTESLPSNCSWYGNNTITQTIQVSLNNCCYPYTSMNHFVNQWQQAAKNARPGSAYLITGYQHMGGFMQTTFGPYILNIKVTYRQKMCSIDSQISIRR